MFLLGEEKMFGLIKMQRDITAETMHFIADRINLFLDLKKRN